MLVASNGIGIKHSSAFLCKKYVFKIIPEILIKKSYIKLKYNLLTKSILITGRISNDKILLKSEMDKNYKSFEQNYSDKENYIEN